MPYDGGDLYIKVELYIDGAWIEVTSRARGGRAASGVEIERGRGTGAIQAETAMCELTLGNDDAFVTEGNPESPWYPHVGRGCRIRVSIADVDVADVVRFDGEIDTMVAVYPGGSDSSMRITATGDLGGKLGLGSDPLQSPLHRTMSGITPADVVPHVYWSLEDGAGATQAASGLPNGTPMSMTSTIEFAADSDLVGSGSLPTLSAGATLTGSVPAYSDAGQWFINVAINVPSEPGAQATLLEVRTTGGTIAFWRLLLTPGSPSQLEWQAYGTDGVALVDVNEILAFDGSGGGKPTEAAFYGSWFFLVLGSVQRSATVVGASAGMTNGTSFPSVGGFQNTGTHSRITSIRLGSGTIAFSAGHLGLFVDTAFAEASGSNQNVSAFLGHAGETVDERLDRLCREEGITITITGTSTQTMGPQGIDTLANLLIDGEAVDGGLLSDGGDGLDYRCLSSIVNQLASLAVTQGSLDVDVAPIWDNRNIRNDVTISRPRGSSAHITDEAHIARTRKRIKDSNSANVETDEQLPDQAGWRVNVGTADGPRYNGVGINLRNTYGALLADAVLGLEMGDRFTAAEAALPPQHPPGGIDGLVVGWAEELDKDKWVFSPKVVPYAPYVVTELDDDDLGKLDTDGSDLTAAVDSDDTTLSVATQTGTSPLWPTDAGEMPIPLIVAGEVMSATAIAAPTTITFGAAGTASHASNASVTPGIPASVAAGNLLIVLAAIRNSGTGVPDTPSGYTRLPVFASTDNVQVFAKVAVGGDAAPTITFTGGVANATTSAQMCRIAGAFSTPDEAFVIAATQLNASAQDIGYPCLALTRPQLDTAINNAIVFYLGWKQDDWTSVATLAGATEIGEASSTTGDDQALVWDYTIQTTATDIVPGSFVVTGGASAISRGAVVAIRSNIQAVTVTRSVNSVVKSQVAGAAVNVHKPARLAL